MDIESIKKIQNESDCLFTAGQINIALDTLAEKITEDLKDEDLIMLCVMTGGVISVGHLATRLSFPLQIDYIHVTRYGNNTRGGELHWIKEPSISLKGKNVLIVDDIFDEGITLLEIDKYCKENDALSVRSAVLVNKIHDRKVDYQPDYIALEVEDRYLFGFGMDYKSYFRNVNAIHAVKGM